MFLSLTGIVEAKAWDNCGWRYNVNVEAVEAVDHDPRLKERIEGTSFTVSVCSASLLERGLGTQRWADGKPRKDQDFTLDAGLGWVFVGQFNEAYLSLYLGRENEAAIMSLLDEALRFPHLLVSLTMPLLLSSGVVIPPGATSMDDFYIGGIPALVVEALNARLVLRRA